MCGCFGVHAKRCVVNGRTHESLYDDGEAVGASVWGVMHCINWRERASLR